MINFRDTFLRNCMIRGISDFSSENYLGIIVSILF
nr:MAG TPA: hypothetical protein [Caudoviricetes sp.]